jgi:quercetin dioxygenase-like cupin family protein
MRYSDSPAQRVAVGNGEWVDLCDGVRQAECRLPVKSCTLLNVEMQPGATIPRHNHPDQVEGIFVVEGSVHDLETGAHTTAHNIYQIPVAQFHTIQAGDHGALLNVLFIPKILPS